MVWICQFWTGTAVVDQLLNPGAEKLINDCGQCRLPLEWLGSLWKALAMESSVKQSVSFGNILGNRIQVASFFDKLHKCSLQISAWLSYLLQCYYLLVTPCKMATRCSPPPSYSWYLLMLFLLFFIVPISFQSTISLIYFACFFYHQCQLWAPKVQGSLLLFFQLWNLKTMLLYSRCTINIF